MNNYVLLFLKFYLSQKCSNSLIIKLLNEFKNDILFLIDNFDEIKLKFNLKFDLATNSTSNVSIIKIVHKPIHQ